MKKKFFSLSVLLLVSLNIVSAQAADPCDSARAKDAAKQALHELWNSQDLPSINDRYGMVVGPCDYYSLQKYAKRPHSPRPRAPVCGVRFVFSNETAAASAAGQILDTLGTSITTETGNKVRLCISVNPGRHPQVR